MSELGTLHQFPTAHVDRSMEPEALRSSELLEVPATPPDIASIGGLDSMRLGAALSFRSRWPLIAMLALVSLMAIPGLLDARDSVQQSAHGVVLFLIAMVGVIRGVDGDGRARSFWHGMGVQAPSFELGIVLVDLLFMALPTLGAVLLEPDHALITLLVTGFGFAAYGLGSATRAAAPSAAGRSALIGAMLGVMCLGTVVAFLCSFGHVILGILGQLVFVATAGVVARVMLAGWAPQSSAGRGRGRGHAIWLGCALTGFLVVPIQFMQGMPGSTAPVPDAAGLFLPDGDPMAGQQVWRVGEDGQPERLSLRGRLRFVESGPHGAAAFSHKDLGAIASMLLLENGSRESGAGSMRVDGTSRFGMVTADGRHIGCEDPLLSGSTVFDPDGMGATRTLSSGETWRLDDDGCQMIRQGEMP